MKGMAEMGGWDAWMDGWLELDLVSGCLHGGLDGWLRLFMTA